MHERRRIGITLLIAGGLLVTLAVSRYAFGAATQRGARAEWDDAHAEVGRARARADRDFGRGVVHPGSAVARIVIPKIGLDEIVLEGVDARALNGGPGHLPGSPFPGEKGNAIISAHRDRHFRRLGELAIGDTVRSESGSIDRTWVIIGKRIVDKNSRVLFPSKTSMLTLTTCWPLTYLGPAPDRLILTARPAREPRN